MHGEAKLQFRLLCSNSPTIFSIKPSIRPPQNQQRWVDLVTWPERNFISSHLSSDVSNELVLPLVTINIKHTTSPLLRIKPAFNERPNVPLVFHNGAGRPLERRAENKRLDVESYVEQRVQVLVLENAVEEVQVLFTAVRQSVDLLQTVQHLRHSTWRGHSSRQTPAGHPTRFLSLRHWERTTTCDDHNTDRRNRYLRSAASSPNGWEALTETDKQTLLKVNRGAVTHNTTNTSGHVFILSTFYVKTHKGDTSKAVYASAASIKRRVIHLLRHLSLCDPSPPLIKSH